MKGKAFVQGETREKVRQALKAGPQTALQVAAQVGITDTTARHHLRKLIDGGAVTYAPGYKVGIKGLARFALTGAGYEPPEAVRRAFAEGEHCQRLEALLRSTTIIRPAS